jgi:hypothetical protein
MTPSNQRFWLEQAEAERPSYYTRHGTTTLFAALSLLDGKAIGSACRATGAGRVSQFLRTVNRTLVNGGSGLVRGARPAHRAAWPRGAR